MEALKRTRAWISGPKSDFPLFLLVLVLANAVSAGAFFRIDLTARRSYTLSEASRAVVKSIQEPLSVKVFFSAKLPAPYNGVERYLRDLLVEYGGVGNDRFSYAFFDMEQEENRQAAESYGIYPVQIQELKNDEVGFKNAYMGLAIVHSDSVETMNGLVSAEGLEYRLTTTIGKVLSSADALAGLSGPVTVTLYASSSLKSFRIQGFENIERTVKDAFDRVNHQNRGRLEFRFVDSAPAGEELALSDRYGLQRFDWERQSGGLEAGSGLLGIVLENGDRSRTLPIGLAQGLLGYGLSGLDDLEKTLAESLRSLAANSPVVAYLTGHGERSLSDDQNGAARFAALAADSYEFVETDLSTEEVPGNAAVLVVNGPRSRLSEAELYRIDQYLLRGGSVLALVDPYLEIASQAGFGGEPTYAPIDSGLGRLLERYGVKVGANYVLDEECFVSRQRGVGDLPIHYAPIVGRKGLDRKSPVSRGLPELLFLKSAELSLSVPDGSGRTGVLLASSSPESWTVSGNFSLSPYATAKPEAGRLASRGLVALVEGRFESAFDAAPEAPGAAEPLAAKSALAKSVQGGKLIVAGSSELAGPALLDEEGRRPEAIFLRNALDYLAGNGELADMRVKGLSSSPLENASGAAKIAAKSLNMYGLPLLVALAGLVAWRLRSLRREKIRARYDRADAERKEE
jgi:ABC-type uncharacterized transport system involved in gliding motility auxiliary subunit